MILKKKKILSKSLSLILAFTMIFAGTTTVFAARLNGIRSGSENNGSVNVYFDEEVTPTASDFTIDYRIKNSSEEYKNLTVRTVTNVSNRKEYKLTFDSAPTSSTRDDLMECRLKYGTYEETFEFWTNSKNATDFKIISSDNGNFTVEFTDSKSNFALSDFTTLVYIDGSNKGALNLTRYDKISGYNDKRYTVYYNGFRTTSASQYVEIEMRYLGSDQQTNKFTLYSNGTVSNDNIGSEYDGKDPALFEIRSITNGEVTIRFKNSTNSVLRSDDFYADYYIDGKAKDLKITGIDEDTARNGIDYKLYFDLVESSNDDTVVTVLLFYRKNGDDRQPAKAAFKVNDYTDSNELVISIKEQPTFKDKVKIPTITIEEKGRNLIYPSPASSGGTVEYLKLTAPTGFEWSKSASVSGTGSLKSAREYNVSYEKVKSEEQKHILLVGLYNIDKSRTSLGILKIDDLELIATDKASLGDVKISLEGGGIPFERFTIAKLSETTTPPITDPSTSHEVQIKSNNNFLLVNGAFMDMKTSAYVDGSGRVMIPASFIAFAFGFNTVRGQGWDWNDQAKEATFMTDGKTIKFQSGSSTMTVNGTPTTMDTTAVIKDDRIFVPIRFLGEAIGFTFVWDDNTKTATATKSK